MSSSLVPLLLAYGEGLPDDTPVPDGEAASVEEVLLRTTRAALDKLPGQAPPAGAVEAVMEAARVAAATSELATLRAVMAESPAAPSAEHALLASTWKAVQRLERPAPPPNAIEAVVRESARAARASELASVRRVIAGERIDADDAEGRLLAASLAALSGLPREAPPAETVEAILAAAGDAARASVLAPVRSALAGDLTSEGSEAALLRTTWAAVERLPRPAPPVNAVHAVLSAAHAALPPAQRARARAQDRAAESGRFPLRLLAYATTAFAFVGLVSVALWTSGNGRPEMTASTATAEEAAPPVDAPRDNSAAQRDAAPGQEADLLAAAPAAGAPLAAQRAIGSAAGGQAAFAPPPPPPAPPPPAEFRAGAEMEETAAARQEALRPAAIGLVTATADDTSPGAGLAGAPALTPNWEPTADVRMLSLRLAAMQEQNAGVDWSEPPTAIGGREEGGLTPAGFNAVGDRGTPARFQVRVNPND